MILARRNGEFVIIWFQEKQTSIAERRALDSASNECG
jgi:hypothetical protein